MISNGYSINGGDICIFSKFQEKPDVIICLYVDDMLIFGTDIERFKEINKIVSSFSIWNVKSWSSRCNSGH